MLRWTAIGMFCLSFGIAAAQQQTLFSNYLLNPYLYNSAYAGSVPGNNISIGYRNQWVGFEGAPKTYLVSGYGNLKKKPNMALGGMVMTERIGLLQRTSFYGTYSYILKINKKANINFGLGLGGIQHKVRVYDAKPYDKDDNFLGSDVLNAFAIDANAGFYFYTKNFFLGFSDQQMPNSKILWDNSQGKNTNHFYATTGYNFSFGAKREWIAQPSMLARTNGPAPYQLEFMAKLMYREMIWLGFSYRQNSSTSFLIGCKIQEEFVFGYAYDFTLTQLRNYSSGTHELVLSYIMPFKKKKSKSDLIKDADEEELNKIDNSVKTNLRNKKKKEKEQEKEKEQGEEKTAEPSNNQDQPEQLPAENKEPVTPQGDETESDKNVQPNAQPQEQQQPVQENATEPTVNPEPQATEIKQPEGAAAPASETPAVNEQEPKPSTEPKNQK